MQRGGLLQQWFQLSTRILSKIVPVLTDLIEHDHAQSGTRFEDMVYWVLGIGNTLLTQKTLHFFTGTSNVASSMVKVPGILFY